MENVKDHVYVKDNKDARPIICEVINFLEDMNSVTTREYEVYPSAGKLFSISFIPNFGPDNYSTYSNAENSSRHYFLNWWMAL